MNHTKTCPVDFGFAPKLNRITSMTSGCGADIAPADTACSCCGKPLTRPSAAARNDAIERMFFASVKERGHA